MIVFESDQDLNPKTAYQCYDDRCCWVHTLQIVFEELEALGLSEPVHKPEPKKRGRKKKEPEVSKTKRSRGRPRKDANQSVGLL